MPRQSHRAHRIQRIEDRLALLLLPLAALIVVLPLILHGCSCGHDFEFHLQSWLDAAAQMRHGTLDPQWTRTAAWNAGEPRFLFYPPLSWIFGAVLTLLLPFSAAPIVFTWTALSGAALAMYFLARAFSPPPAALLCSALYMANPYMLFTAFERAAYAELLAAAWMPLLLLGLLKSRPKILGVAVPLALLWLTNAPAAVIGTYAVAFVASARVLLSLWRSQRHPGQPTEPNPLRMLLRFAAGFLLGLALPAFYLLPAAYERKYVQVAMAIIPGMRPQDNFLFGHTGDGPHDAVLHTASIIAITLLAAAALATCIVWLLTRSTQRRKSHPSSPPPQYIPQTVLPLLALLTATIAFLLTPLSNQVWQHLPELAFLQFPWRMLLLLGPVLALAVALLLRAWTRFATVLSAIGALLIVAALTYPSIAHFRQTCEAADEPAGRALLFRTHHGMPPTDEYTPTDADNDVLRWDDPSYWLASDAAVFASATVPNPAATIVNYDTPPPLIQTVSGIAPHTLHLHLSAPETLILNLRDYPAWRVTRNGLPVTQRLQRDDGLLAISLPAGESTVEVRWHRTRDEWLGDGISLAALLALAGIAMRSRTISGEDGL